VTNVLRIFLCTTFFYKNNKNNDTTSIIPPPHSAQMSIVQLFSQILILFHKWMKALKKSFGNDDLSLKVASSHLFLDIHYFTWMTSMDESFEKAITKKMMLGLIFLRQMGPSSLGNHVSHETWNHLSSRTMFHGKIHHYFLRMTILPSWMKVIHDKNFHWKKLGPKTSPLQMGLMYY